MSVSREDVLCTLHLWCYLILSNIFNLVYAQILTFHNLGRSTPVHHTVCFCWMFTRKEEVCKCSQFLSKISGTGAIDQIKLKVVRNFVTFVWLCIWKKNTKIKQIVDWQEYWKSVEAARIFFFNFIVYIQDVECLKQIKFIITVSLVNCYMYDEFYLFILRWVSYNES